MILSYFKTRQYKYETAADYFISYSGNIPRAVLNALDHTLGNRISNDYFMLTLDHPGSLTLFVTKGYRWDGSSGPTVDTKNTMRASLMHDVLYQCLRERFFENISEDQHDEIRKWADRLYYRMLRKAGMSWFRARAHYRALRVAGSSSADPKNVHKKVILTA